MLAKVFDEALMGGIYKMDHYSVAAKTGTAQAIIEGEKGYQEGQFVHTFFGYAPAFDAKFLTFLFLVKPQGVRYASHSLSEPFVNITKFLLNYYEIPPDR
jgi:cell division protein FtsI/penicillin-binding protein 2